MGRLFNYDSPFMQTLTRFATVFFCGICWLLCCIPIITAGASNVAMYRMMFNIREEKPAGAGMFFKTFAKEFGKSTILWLIDLIFVALLAIGYWMIASASEKGTGSALLLIVFFIPFFLWMTTFAYVFPLNSYFENTIGRTILNGLLISLRYLRFTVPVLAMSLIPIIGFVISEYYFILLLPLWVLVAIPLIFYFQSHFFLKVFTDLIPAEENSGLSEGSGSVDEISG